MRTIDFYIDLDRQVLCQTGTGRIIARLRRFAVHREFSLRDPLGYSPTASRMELDATLEGEVLLYEDPVKATARVIRPRALAAPAKTKKQLTKE